MTMSWSEHVKQAEMLLREAAENPTDPASERLVWVTTALVHAALANAKQVVK